MKHRGQKGALGCAFIIAFMSLWFRTDAQCPAFIQACTESD